MIPVEAAAVRPFARFAEMVRRASGIVLDESKRPLLEARLGGLAQAAGFDDMDHYLAHVAGAAGAKERAQVLDLLTTNTTAFFREAHHFELLRTEVLPAFRASKPASQTFRAWSAACSSGEEPYSLAITLERARASGLVGDYRVLATDISPRVLETARRGIYPRDRLRELGREILEGHFEPVRERGAPAGRVVGPARAAVSFHPFNLVESAWRIRHRFDLILCRNVLIYFDEVTRREVVGRLVAQLAPGGVLALGHSDTTVSRSFPLEPIGPTMYRLGAVEEIET